MPETIPNELIVDLNEVQRFKESLKLLDERENIVKFINATEEQIVFTESDSNVVITVYETDTVIQWWCDEYVGNPMWSDEKQMYRLHKCRYNISDGKHELLEDLGYTYVKSLNSIDLTAKTYYALNEYKEFIGLSDNTSEPKSTASNIVIPNTNFPIGTVTLKNGASLTNDYSLLVLICNAKGKVIKTFDFVNDNMVFNPVKVGHIYTGNWLNEKVSSTLANETFNLKTGENTITYDLLTKQGKDTVIITAGGTYNLLYENTNGIKNSYVKSGNDVIMITEKLDGVNYQEYARITLKNYFSVGNKATVHGSKNGFDENVIISNLNKTYDRKNAKKAQKISDTFLDETMYGGDAADTITSSGGNDKITGGKGNDKISLSNGIKTLYYTKGDGHDIITAKKGTTLDFQLQDIPTFVNYTKNGNDLIITAKDNYSSATNYYTITIKNYFKLGAGIEIQDNKFVKVQDIVNYLNNQFYNKKDLIKPQTITDTFLSGEYIYGGSAGDTIKIVGGSNSVYGNNGNDTITVKAAEEDLNNIYGGNGNDKINILSGGSNIVHGGAGNDVISSKGSDDSLYGESGNDKITSSNGNAVIKGGEGDDTISVSNGEKRLLFNKGDGYDTISIGKNAEVELVFDEGKSINGLVFGKSGNNLIIYRQGAIVDNVVMADTSDSITIKNAFTGNYDITVTYRKGDSNYSYKLIPSEQQIRWYGSDEKKNTITASPYDDYVYAGNLTTKIVAGEGKNYIYQSKNGTDSVITAGKDDDTYYVYDLSKTLKITDAGGVDDIIISDSVLTDRFFFFDINQKKGLVTSCGTYLDVLAKEESQSMDDYISGIITSKNKIVLKPSMQINNYFTKKGENGTGYIEVIEGIEDYDFDTVRGEVASWLYEKGYSSVSQFFTKGAGEDTAAYAKELFAIYVSGFNQE